jgi:hypothetical protein
MIHNFGINSEREQVRTTNPARRIRRKKMVGGYGLVQSGS